VKLLLDTGPFLWYITGDRRLPDRLRRLIREPDQEVFLSVVSVWEATVKQGLGRLPLPAPAGTYLPGMRARHGIAPLALEESAVSHLAKLPATHRDPFDRMLVCQAIEHELTIVTPDEVVRSYPIRTLWDP